MNTDHRRGFRSFLASAAPVLAVALVGCAHASAPADSPEIAALRGHVKRVVVDESNNAHPDKVLVKKNVEIVTWVTKPGYTLEISFPENPFAPEVVRCVGSFCGVLVPPSGAYKEYPYAATVTKPDGTSKKMDPRLEVVP